MADLYTSYETSLALQSTGAPQDVLGAFLDSLARRAEGDEMTAPTPGPWKAKASSSSMNAWVLAGEHVIAVTSKEDAALIAAAPDLLAALVALVKVIDRADDRECPAAALTSGGEVIEAGKPHFCVCGHDHAESFRARIAELEAERDRYRDAIREWHAHATKRQPHWRDVEHAEAALRRIAEEAK